MAEHERHDGSDAADRRALQDDDQDGDGAEGKPADDGKAEKQSSGKQSGDGDQSDEDAKHDEERNRARPFVRVALVLFVLLLVGGGVYYWLTTRGKETTDDAFTAGRLITIAPHVTGYVTELDVNDNEFVHQGQLLLRIDQRDYLAARDQSKASLDSAKSQVQSSKYGVEVAKQTFPAQLKQAQGALLMAQAQEFRAETDYRRQHSIERAATTQQDIDYSTAALDQAKAQVIEAQGQVAQATPVTPQISTQSTRVDQQSCRAGGGAGGTRSRQPQPRVDHDPGAQRRLDRAAQRRARQLRDQRPGAVLDRRARRLDHRQLQGDRDHPDARRPAGADRGRRLSEPAPERPRRQHPARRRLRLQRLSARERHRQLRQDRAARAGQDRDRQRPRPAGAAADRHLGRADGGHPMSGESGKPSKDAGWKPKGNPWLIAVVVTLAAFMEVLDTTIVNVSLPHIAGDLSTSYDDASWALTSYLAANGIVLTISGWLGRVIGRKRYFLICIGMFTVCSFLCGVSQSLPELIVFRLLQGLFGGGLQPNQQSIILDTFPPARRGGAFAITAVATIVAPVLGPTLGGYITDNASWRWVFFLNVPIGIFTLLAVSALVEDPPWAKKRSAPIDAIGLGLIALGLGCLEVALDRGEDDDWFGSTFICVMALLALIGIFGAICWLLTAKRPAVDLRVFGDANFAIGTMGIGVVGVVLYAGAVLIPQFSQQVIGYTATLAGLVLTPGGVGIIVLIPFVNLAMKRIQTRYIIAFGFFVMGVSLLYSGHLIRRPTSGSSWSTGCSRPPRSPSCSCRSARSPTRRCRAA